MTEPSDKDRNWSEGQMAEDEGESDADREANEARSEPADQAHWNKQEWVGEDASGHRPAPESPEEMPEGEAGLSGSRQNPGASTWASDDPHEEKPQAG
jgi:hypothetical protein